MSLLADLAILDTAEAGNVLADAAEAVVARHRLLATDAACPEETALPRDVAALAAAVVAWRRVTGRG